jgi:hypothetical protein
VTIPTTDFDSNGIPDLLQYDRDGNFTATGSGLSAPSNLTFSISVRFTRPAGTAIGSYTATTQNSAGQANVVNGVYELLSYQGTVSYSRGTTNTMAITATILSNTSITLTGSTSYTITSVDQISYPAFTIKSNASDTYHVRAGTLTRSGNVYRGNFNLVDGLPQTLWADFTEYVLAITDPNDADGNGIPDFSDPTAVSPVISTQPRATSATSGQTISLSVVATGAISYQWTKNGVDVAGATSATLSFQSVQLSDTGSYAVKITNAAGTTTSTSVNLTVSPAPAPPAFTVQPLPLTAAARQTVVLNAEALGYPTPTLQWRKDGASIAGATTNLLVLSSLSTFAAGNYTCVATNASGTATSSAAFVSVSDSSDVGRIINLSVLTSLDAAGSSFTMGAVVGGAGTRGTKPLLFRAAGPSLSQFGVSGAHPNPQIEIFAGSLKVGANDDWGGDAATANAFAQVGAFGFSNASSKDAAVFSPAVPIGDTSIKVSGVEAGIGTVLAEIYDATGPADRTSATPRLIDVSLLKPVTAGAPVTVGFVLGGSTATTVLVRAVGPALSQFGVTDTLADPQLTLYQSNATSPRATNDNWGTPAAISNVFAAVGAFALSNGSKDAALLLTLPPGAYSAQIANAGAGTGTVLAEVYEVPPALESPVNLSDRLIAYYSFNGNANDESGNGNNASPAGSFQYVSTDLSGSALRILGDNSLFYAGGGHVLLPQFGSSMNSGFTLSLWTRDEVIGSDPVGQEDYISFGILDQAQTGITLSNRSGRLWADFYLDAGLGGAAHLNAVILSKELGDPVAAAASWKHLVMAYTPGKLTAFVNGEKVGEKFITANGFPFARAALGRHWWGAGSSSSARMSVTYDNVRIYSRTLTDSEVQALYQNELGR